MTTALVLCALAASSGCLPVKGDRIRAGDLARAIPAFAAAPPETVLGHAPAPGARRVFRFPELKRLAARHGVSIDPAEEACFTVPVRPLATEELVAAMGRSLGEAGVRIEILDHSRFPAPAGTIEFPLSGLGQPAAPHGTAPVVWKGFVRYGGERRFRVWARVKVSAPARCIVALEPLPARKPIELHQVRMEDCERFPSPGSRTVSVEDAAGRLPRRAVPAGAWLSVEETEAPKAVARGEMVAVEARMGAAEVRFEGRAESAGGTGDVVSVRNPSSGRIFKARVKRKGLVAVENESNKEQN